MNDAGLVNKYNHNVNLILKKGSRDKFKCYLKSYMYDKSLTEQI